MADFHFLRPFWLLLLLTLPALPWIWRRIRQRLSGWESLVPSPLLQPLVRDAKSRPVRLNAAWPMALVLIAAVALAGPSWRRAPTPLQQQNDSLVVVMNMTPSMLSTDIKPSRLVRAKQKLRDLLRSRRGAFTALVVYAGDAHVVTPLTDDRRTIAAMLPAVTPSVMPSSGDRPDRGVAKAIDLIRQGAPGPAHILLITDRVSTNAAGHIVKALKGTPYRMDILGVGTTAGAPIPIAGKGFVRDHGKIVMAKADPRELAELAAQTHGKAHMMTVTDADLRALGVTGKQSGGWRAAGHGLQINLWKDDGYWLLWLLLPIGLLCWRRGMLMLVPLLLLPLFPAPAQASTWQNLWQRPDQQGYELFQRHPTEAAKAFTSPAWRGAALYRSGHYEAAAKAFAKAKGPNAAYNRGNALAKAGHLRKAIAAYNAALKAAPKMMDARDNKALVEKLLKQQKKQQQKKQNDQDSQGKRKQTGGKPGRNPTDSGNKSRNQSQSHQKRSQRSNQRQNDSGQQRSGENRSQADNTDSKDTPQQSPPQETSQSGRKDKNADRSNKESGTGQKNRPGSATELAGADQNRQAGKKLSQSDQQWLRLVPDDPSGFLRRKFLYQYQQQRNNNSGRGNDAPW